MVAIPTEVVKKQPAAKEDKLADANEAAEANGFSEDEGRNGK
jgi:hypothetical protein